MPRLEISLNCLCLFAPDPTERVMHVLMPAMHHHQHVIRVLNGRSPETGWPMEGLVLRAGPKNGASADVGFTAGSRHNGAELADLSSLAGSLDRGLLTGDPRAAARVELRSGRIREMNAEASWVVGGRRIAAAHQVVWEVGEVTEDVLEWKRHLPTGAAKPFESLDDLAVENGVLRLDVYHVTPDALPPTSRGVLDPAALRSHFRGYYGLQGSDGPRDESDLPRDPIRLSESTQEAIEILEEAAGTGNPELAEALAGIRRLAADPIKSDALEGAVASALRLIDRYNCAAGKSTFA
jgi:hypothetical protein